MAKIYLMYVNFIIIINYLCEINLQEFIKTNDSSKKFIDNDLEGADIA